MRSAISSRSPFKSSQPGQNTRRTNSREKENGRRQRTTAGCMRASDRLRRLRSVGGKPPTTARSIDQTSTRRARREVLDAPHHLDTRHERERGARRGVGVLLPLVVVLERKAARRSFVALSPVHSISRDPR